MRHVMRPLFLALSLGSGATAIAQCEPVWEGLSRLAGANAEVFAVASWDVDGAGPLPPRLVAGGRFTVIGSTTAGGVAVFDEGAGLWSDAGGGVSEPFLGETVVRAFATLPGGDLVVAGQFLRAGNLRASNIARWDGTTWQSLGDGLGGPVHALAVLANGDLVAGGNFYFAGGNFVSNVARWDGSTWSPLGAGLNDTVYALAVLPSGGVLAGGRFTATGVQSAGRLAWWNGTSWAAYAGGLPGDVLALAVAANGTVAVAGTFQNGPSASNGVALWNGAWSNLGGGTTASVRTVSWAPNGDLLAGGLFTTIGGVAAPRVARWNGLAWSPLASGLPVNGASVNALHVLPAGEIVAGGSIANGDGLGTDHIVRLTGATWSSLAPGTGGSVNASLQRRSGELVVAGSFLAIDAVPCSRIAQWSNGSWSALGSGVDGTVNCLLEMPNGEIVVGGSFQSAGGLPASNIARWNGAAWAPIGAGLPAAVFSLAVRPNGSLVAGGAFFERVAVWSGSVWSGTGIGSSLAPSVPVRALAQLPSGDLVASAASLFLGQAHARWNGASWSTIPGLALPANAYAVARNGDLLATGSFSSSCLARWNGTTWSLAGPPSPLGGISVVELPDGDLLVGGQFTNSGATPMSRVARWRAGAWQPVGVGVDGVVRTLTMTTDGGVFVGGDFSASGSQVAARMARLATTCPAGALVVGTGCSGSGGANVLAATSLPWIGGTFRSTASGLPTNGVAIEVLGFAPASVPLAALLPQGGAGCDLLVTPALSALQLPTAGSVGLQFVVPNDLALVGAIVRQQVLAAELDPQANLIALTASNALQLVVGAF